jgi:hypothetical protein
MQCYLPAHIVLGNSDDAEVNNDSHGYSCSIAVMREYGRSVDSQSEHEAATAELGDTN